MKQKKFKIPPHLAAEIVRRAAELPPVAKMSGDKPIYRSCIVKGTEVTAEDLKPGTPIHPNLSYKINRLVYENHAENIVKGIQASGKQDFLDDYCAGVMAMHNNLKAQVDARNSFKTKLLIFLYKLTSMSWLKKKSSN